MMINVEKTAEDKKEWFGILTRLWIAIGKDVEPNRLELYGRELSRVPMGVLEMAIGEVVRANKFLAVPTVRTIWQAIFRLVGCEDGQDIDACLERWCYNYWPTQYDAVNDEE